MHRLKHLAFGGAMTALAFTSVRADEAAPAPPTTQLQVNAQDLAYINVALSAAAGTCATNSDGCEVGRYKHLTDIEARLQAAALDIQKKVKEQAAKAKK